MLFIFLALIFSVWIITAKKIFDRIPLGFSFRMVISFFVSLTLLGFLFLLFLFAGINYNYFIVTSLVLPLIVLSKLKWKLGGVFGDLNIRELFFEKRGTFICAGLLAITYLWTKSDYRWGDWDGVAIWNMHAKFLIDDVYWTNMFKVGFSHPDYPLLLPASIALFWKSIGFPTPYIPSMLAYVITISIPFAGFSSLRSKGKNLMGYLFFLLIALDSHFLTRGASQYADSFLSLFILLTIILIKNFEGKSKWEMYLIGFLGASCGFIKNEGLVFVAILFLIVLSNDKLKRQFKEFITGAMIPIVFILIFKLIYAPANDLIEGQSANTIKKIFEPERYIFAIKFFAEIIFTKHFLFLILSVITFYKSRIYFLSKEFVALILVLLAYYSIYIITPNDLEWHLETSFDRLFHQLYPALMYTMLLSLGSVVAFDENKYWKRLG